MENEVTDFLRYCRLERRLAEVRRHRQDETGPREDRGRDAGAVRLLLTPSAPARGICPPAAACASTSQS